MRSLTLSPAQQRRIEKLAALAGRSSEAMLRFVLSDGLEATERDVRETLEADTDINRNGGLSHAKVMTDARAVVGRHASKRRTKVA